MSICFHVDHCILPLINSSLSLLILISPHLIPDYSLSISGCGCIWKAMLTAWYSTHGICFISLNEWCTLVISLCANIWLLSAPQSANHKFKAYKWMLCCSDVQCFLSGIGPAFGMRFFDTFIESVISQFTLASCLVGCFIFREIDTFRIWQVNQVVEFLNPQPLSLPKLWENIHSVLSWSVSDTFAEAPSHDATFDICVLFLFPIGALCRVWLIAFPGQSTIPSFAFFSPPSLILEMLSWIHFILLQDVASSIAAEPFRCLRNVLYIQRPLHWETFGSAKSPHFQHFFFLCCLLERFQL